MDGILVIVFIVAVVYGTIIGLQHLPTWVAQWQGYAAGADQETSIVYCSNKNAQNLQTCNNPQALLQTAYKIDPANQFVISWFPSITTNGSPTSYTKLKGCTVADKDNWNCNGQTDTSIDTAVSFGYNQGKPFYTDSSVSYTKNIIFVSPSEYMQVQKEKINNIQSQSLSSSGGSTVSSSSIQPSSDVSQQTIETSDDPFPVQDTECNSAGCPQYKWYDRHNVAMAYRCYTGTQCTAQQWAFAVYANSNDPRGQTLEQQANSVADASTSQFPSGKCVTESGVQICDLSYNVISQSGNTRTIKMQGNEITCQDLATNNSSDVRSDTTNISTDPQFCATDFGAIYIDPTIEVKKYYGDIQVGNSSYTVPSSYGSCIWTYNGGNGDIPYIEMSNQVGPDSSFYNVYAFCQNGSNQVDIYSYETNS